MVDQTRGAKPGFVPDIRPAADVTIRFRMMALNGIAMVSSNAEVYSTIYARVRELVPCAHTLMFDCAFGNGVGSVSDAENEENGIWGLTAWDSKIARARDAVDAYVDAFGELSRAYAVRNKK